ncbi:small GTP-binding protein [Tritrichomonas foetus]|uniref:Small GTP-binding protein n=1 Tax=Tritrichomonas foetus TaxID=1144522 RepID=A0A1J4KR02_9EUKA|nr:small GTP-binding protein [Tritrichomonas foetus]|eukprot:OHT12228.1 small GTP-binding protein [Tritrichomonas foetus]
MFSLQWYINCLRIYIFVSSHDQNIKYNIKIFESKLNVLCQMTNQTKEGEKTKRMKSDFDHEKSFPLKVVLLGATTVGKTSIVNAAMNNEVMIDQQPTIGACFVIKKVKVEDSLVRLHIWDKAGQERFRALTPMYFRDANSILLVYAVNDEVSFNYIGSWINCIETECHEKPKLYLVANKNDLEDSRKISIDQGERYAKEINADFCEVSALTRRDEILDLFYRVAQDSIASQAMMRTNNIIPTSHKTEEKNGCY